MTPAGLPLIDRPADLEPVLAHGSADARVATVDGAAVSAGRFARDVAELAARIRAHGNGRARWLLNACSDRYWFAVSFCAAIVAERINLLPPSRAPQAMARLASRYPDLVVVADRAGIEAVDHDGLPPPLAVPGQPAAEPLWPPPAAPRDRAAAIAFTSGSTGEPAPQTKYWGGVVDGARAEIAALGLDDARRADIVLVGTVSAQHMYGLESSVIMALHGPFAFAAEHPLHPEQVAQVLHRQQGRRVLITTPVHLRALAETGVALPTMHRVVSATAPLPAELAQRCEDAWAAPVLEVYGCTETGMLATRRTTEGPRWQALRDVRIEQRGAGFWAQGGHVVVPGPLADQLRLVDGRHFELEGRLSDVVNIAGRRASLAALSLTLQQIPGVTDGAFAMPDPDPADGREPRLLALAVAPTLTRSALMDELRKRIDAVFLPRPLLLVEALPRNAQGKLPRADILKLAAAAERGELPPPPARRVA